MNVVELWRFPVKWMGGTRVDALRIDRRGGHADRLWAVRDVEKGVTASARRIPVLLQCSARYATEPAEDAGPGNVPAVVITMPDGREFDGADPAADTVLSELVGREVRLVALPAPKDTSAHRMSLQASLGNFSADQVRRDFGLGATDELPDTSVFSTRQMVTLARYSTPPGTFVDLSPVHVLSTASLRSLSADGNPYDVRRFRPNVLVDIDIDLDIDEADGFPESAWVGGQVRLGTVVLSVTNPTIRCVVPTRPQPGIDLDTSLTRRLAERTDRFLGIYADVATPGMVRVGDEVSARPAASPGAVQRVAAAAGKTATRGLQKVLEATVLRTRS
ncbi:MOSC domain-containing protein [Mycolicibacterium psychrotolerans]|uniref:Molybdenum cofactor biosysynthesis protein n=1 Tax=Mycolicibacterium psychrotolerans TaxID=216929 RepID=A0A7I7MBD0_9MYCO|nr:MOSC domain-containing protein [Mycolicibacterium psychrotolerans]BBX68669.1 molybdenum cofactor biosysynthesis protein [Mycolicibacterium psychrotolerans]